MSTFASPLFRHSVLPLAAAALLALPGCGGGGGDASTTTPTPVPPSTTAPDAATALFTLSSTAATALVRDAEQRTRDLQLASGLAGATTPTGTAGLPLPTAAALRLRPAGTKQALAVENLSADLCSAGTASVDVPDALLARFTANAQATLQAGDRLTFSAADCIVQAAVELGPDVALGNFGVGARISGQFVLDVERLDTASQLLRLSYTGFSWQPAGEAAFDALDAVIRFGTEGGLDVFALDLPGRKFLQTPVVISQDGVITVASGSLRTALPSAAGSGWGDYSFSGWRYTAASGRAAAGSVTVRGAGDALAEITAAADGYSVRFTTAAGTQTHAVGR